LTEEPSLVTAQPEAEHYQQQDSVRAVFGKLYADGRAYADAEIERQKLRANIAGAGVRDAAIFAIAAAMLVFAGLVAFLVGMVLLLSPHLGAGWSAFTVFGTVLLIALILLLFAKARISRMRKAIKS
jgi:hypothetical protein